MKKTLALVFVLICSTCCVLAQKKKVLKEEKISSKTEWQIVNKNGVEVKYKEAEYKFDEKGNVTMEKIYNEDGSIKKHTEWEFDKDGNEIVQVTYNSKGTVDKREEFKFKDGLKIEKKTFGPDGKIVSKRIYEYNRL